MAQGIPPATAMACYRRSRLPFDRLQTLKTLKMPRRPFGALSLGRPCLGHARRQKPPQGHSNGSRHPPRPQQWLLIGVQGCRLTGFKRLKPQNAPPAVCLHSALSLGRPCLGHARGKSHHKATAMAQGIPPAAAMASYRRSRLPFVTGIHII